MQTLFENEIAFDPIGMPQSLAELTPIVRASHPQILVKRDDLFTFAGQRGGKVRTCLYLALNGLQDGGHTLVTASSRSSPQANIVASIAQALDMRARLHIPTGALGPELEAAADKGAEIIQHKPGYNSVICRRAMDDAMQRGRVYIPFGMECITAVHMTAHQARNIPKDFRGRIVVPVGSGMSLAGIVQGLANEKRALSVLGVQVGASPEKRLLEYAPSFWLDETVSLVDAGCDYSQAIDGSVIIQGETVVLDPYYEAKVLRFVEPGDLLWIVGRREVAGW